MKMSVRKREDTVNLNWSGKMALAGIEEGKWFLLQTPVNCRGQIHDAWYFYKHRDYASPPSGVSKRELSKKESVFFYKENHCDKKVEDGLTVLNAIEKKYKLKETTVEKVDGGYLFIGDKNWYSALWKLSIYSYLIKRIFCPTDHENYWKLLVYYEDSFLSKIKTLKKEIIEKPDFYDVHIKSGFVTIGELPNDWGAKENVPMRELILGDKFNPNFIKELLGEEFERIQKNAEDQ